MPGYPLIILSHRRRAFLPQTLESIAKHVRGISNIFVVDDSGSADQYAWLDRKKIEWAPALVDQNAGYLEAMQRVWETAAHLCDSGSVDFAMLWEEDCMINRPVSLHDMADIMRVRPDLAQLNLQRQAVYPIERKMGYLESHVHRGYGLRLHQPERIPSTDDPDALLPYMPAWVERERPFTTNPGMIRRSVLDVEWPSREVCDHTDGGAEVAMSHVLEGEGYHFGWLGDWNRSVIHHVGIAHKTGHGY